MTERIFTTSEIAGMLGVHQITISRWVNSGKLKSMFTLGGHRRIKEKDLVRFFRENDMPVPEDLDIPPEKVKVLVVDDDEPVLDVTAGSLRQRSDFDVSVARDGFEAGRMVGEVNPDIVILDIRLPGVDGFSVCESIKKNYPETRVIAITGFGSDEVQKKIMDAGADLYLEKPFDLKYLILEIESVLNKGLLIQSSK